MDDMRGRYRVPRRDYSQPDSPPQPPVHESLRHAYRPAPSSKPEPEPQPSPVPVHQPAAVHHTAERPHRHPKNHRVFKKLLIILLILAVLGGSGAWAYPKYINPDPFPKAVQSSANFLLFYPSKLPPGYSVNKSSIELNDGKLTYNANNGDKKLVFTSQKVSASLNIQDFTKQYLTNSQQFTTKYGSAVVGKNQDRYLGILVANDTWMIVSTNSTAVTSGDISLAIQNLKKY
jgi:hypothetical protein